MNFFKYTLVRFGLLVFFFYLYELLGAGILVSGVARLFRLLRWRIFSFRVCTRPPARIRPGFKRTPKVKNKEEEENRAIEDELVESQKKNLGKTSKQLPAPASVHVMGGSLRVLASR